MIIEEKRNQVHDNPCDDKEGKANPNKIRNAEHYDKISDREGKVRIIYRL